MSLKIFSSAFKHGNRMLPIVNGIHTTALCNKIKAGRLKNSKFKNTPATYEQSFKPEYIQHKKGWLSFNTSNLHGEKNAHQMAYEDLFIRQFLHGTFYQNILSEVIIKRRLNILEIIIFVEANRQLRTFQQLATYSEEMLGTVFNYNVRVHLFQSTRKRMTFKYV